MNIGPAGIVGSTAGIPLSQTRGTDAERAAHASADSQRTAESRLKAENAAGIGAADGEGNETHERDADGRRLWEWPRETPSPDQAEQPKSDDLPPRSAAGEPDTGSQIDLAG
jgi:hypothetical protein